MTHLRTVLGDIDPSALGRCYAHEHLIIEKSYTTQVFPEIHLPSLENAVAELTDFKRAGGGAMVETMPCDAGRNVVKLAEISRRTGVHIIAPTGLHMPRFYPQGHWRFRVGAEALAEIFTAEIEQGIDANDCAGPVVRRTSFRAGVIKVGSAARGLDAGERDAFEAAAAAHRRTGAPIITHVEPGLGWDQVEFLTARGVEPGHITLSHTDRVTDPGYHRDLLKRGINVEYDRMLRAKLDSSNPTLKLFAAMIAEFPDQVMMGTDGARPTLWRSYGGKPGLDYLLTGFSKLLKEAGVTDALLKKAFIETPARAYAFSR